ncbi:MAG: DUF4968 domain-containing protein [candidate division KSB1 bacterium]|nr:DUF4968 domain-containing protein [candidate division KSB1 bacterium]MDZ7412539.1 DUF4968 domain-containing protein [candidate division KSB1 bacterium]
MPVRHSTPTVAGDAAQLRGPMAFKRGEQVLFHRLHKVLALQHEGQTLLIRCASRSLVNRTVWTHETHMHQLAEKEHREPPQTTVEITFWSAEVFRVRFGWSRVEEGDFPPPQARMLVGKPEPHVPVEVRERPNGWDAQTPAMTLHIDREPFRLWASDAQGRLFWQQRKSELFTADIFDMSLAELPGRHACFDAFVLHGQDEVYGLGERFEHVARKGRPVDFWNKDAIGTSTPRSYINVPFLWCTQGYGLFVNSTARLEWEIGTMEAFTLGLGVEDEELDYFVIHGPTPADILRRYCTLTGFAPTPPVWSFGLWMSRNSYTSWDVVHEVADGLRARRIPCDVLHLDSYWFEEDFNCDLRFSPTRFPEPERHMAQLRRQGFRVSLWQYNFVPPRANNPNYIEGVRRGYFAKDRKGDVFRHPAHLEGTWLDDAIIDFSNPEAVEWYTAQIKGLLHMGASTIKVDFGEGIPEEAVYARIAGRRFHNLYSLVYAAAIAQAVHEVTGEWIIWARSGTAGSQRYPVHWGGDSQCSFFGLAGTVRGALSMGLSGFPFFSHDIGGFIGRPDPELYVRWAQFGLFSSHARCHGAGNDNPREPWTFGGEAEEIFRQYATLRYRLLPYIYDQARKCSATGKPMVRALVIDYPEDRNVWHIEDQYLFGDSLLIAPVLQPLAETSWRVLYLPAGTWWDFWTKKRIRSRGQWIKRRIDLRTMPMYVKAGSIIPYGQERQHTDNQVGPVVLLEVYGGADGRLEYDDGEKQATVTYRQGRVQVTGLRPRPKVKLYV